MAEDGHHGSGGSVSPKSPLVPQAHPSRCAEPCRVLIVTAGEVSGQEGGSRATQQFKAIGDIFSAARAALTDGHPEVAPNAAQPGGRQQHQPSSGLPVAPDDGQTWMLRRDTELPPITLTTDALGAPPHLGTLQRQARTFQTRAREDSTRKSYAHWWQLFAEFCVQQRWAQSPLVVPVPVPVQIVEVWVAWLGQKYAESTIEISLAAISAVHTGHRLPSPTTDKLVLLTLEGIARVRPVRGVTQQVVVEPGHLRAFLQLTFVHSGGAQWSSLRLKRAKAMVFTGFMAWLRKSEVTGLDVCSIVKEVDCSVVTIAKAKNDSQGRGRASIFGARCGDAADLEAAVWDFITAAALSVSSRCTRKSDPRSRCTACGPLFPRLGGSQVQATKAPMGKNTLTAELRSLYQACIDQNLLPATIIPKRFSAIALRRGANSAAAAAGIGNLMRASAGRWKAVETPDQSYTFLHRSEHIDMATRMFEHGR